MDAGKKALDKIGIVVGKKVVVWGEYPLKVGGFALHPTYHIEHKNHGTLIVPFGVSENSHLYDSCNLMKYNIL